VRSSTPPSTLHVGERWRSGDPVLDTQRGIFPAFVLGGTVPCDRKLSINPRLLGLLDAEQVGATRREPLAPRLVVGGRGPITDVPTTGAALGPDDPVHGALVRSPGQQPLRIPAALYGKVSTALERTEPDAPVMPVGDALRQLYAGTAIGVAGLKAALSPAQLASSIAVPVPDFASRVPIRTRCAVRLLQAPMLDDGRPVAIGDQSRSDEVATELDAHGVTHGELDDVVVISTGAFAAFGLLLFIPRAMADTSSYALSAPMARSTS
jgi:hypothetical protein